MKKLIIGAGVAVLSLALPAAAASDTYRVKGESASASFSTSDNCSYTGVSISGYNNVSRTEPGAPTAQNQAFVSYYTYNYCTDSYSSGSGFSSDVNFNSSSALQSASLTGTIPVYDYSTDSTKTLNVNLTWTGTGDLARGRSSYHYHSPGYTSNSRYTGAYRDAEVSGSINLDGTNLIANLSNDYAGLNSSTSGGVTITKR
ncbi:MAG: hypothetical protein KME12_03390 [Trichocoleus desertorum ATA4-8-CV12]|jgi:hypothetical protein|nr:hypothetical protein [Trichocoleus desertorum ATA4-8-CV12]